MPATFSVAHVRLGSVEDRVFVFRGCLSVYVWRKFCRAPVCCGDTRSSFDRKRLGPPVFVWRRKNMFGGAGCLGQRFSGCLE